MPHLRNFIASESDWLNKLIETYRISVVKCPHEPHLVSLKYDIDSPMHEPIVQECRGAVVDTNINKILALPYFKFWNHGEHLAAPINWSSARVQDKLDGSLHILYWDETIDNWRVASSGHPTAGGSIWPHTILFRELFWQTFAKMGMRLPYKGDRGSCFMFELCSPHNRIVCNYPEPTLVCHGARWVDIEWEWQRSTLEKVCQELNWQVVKEYPIGTLDETLKAAEALNPAQNEGFVVVDDAFNRVKIKSPRYVALHHLKSNISSRKNMARLVLSGEDQEFIAYFPEFKAEFEETRIFLDNVMTELKTLYNEYRGIESQKEFALSILGKTKMTAILFNARKQKAEVDEVWKQSTDMIIRSLYE